MSDNRNSIPKEPAQKSADVEEGEVFSQGKSKRDDKDPAQAANGDDKEKDKAKRDKSPREKSSDSEEAADKKSKKKKKDKSKKKEKDKKSEKKADKKEKRSHSREKKPSKRDRDRSSSESRSRSKQRKRSRSRDNKRKKDESKRRSSSRSKRRSSSRQKDRKQDKYRDNRDDRDRSRDVRRKSRSPVRRERSRERARETDTRARRDDRGAPRDYTKERRRDEISKENKERKMEVVEDEPLDEEAQKKIESQLAFAEEDEEAIAARAREQRKALLEQARKAKEEEELAAQQQHQAMAVEEEEKQPETVPEKVIEKKPKDKSTRNKAVKELAEKTESEKTKETTREDKNVAPAEAGDSKQKMQEEESKKDDEENPSKKQSSNYKHDVDKEKYIKMIESMREKLQQEEEDLRENGDAEEREEDKNNEEQGGKKDEAEDFDMFCETPESIEAEKVAAPVVGDDSSTYDDENGYYRGQIGEVVNGRYKILAKLGKGVFGNVFKGTDMQTNQDVAMKVVKSEEIYLMSGLKEKEILTMLNEADRHNKRHVIRLLDSFEYRRHLILVFELMEMDLRSAIKTFGKKLGLSIESVKSYARQLFISLAHLRKHKIIHADLKPDNILVTNNQKTLKLSDFGSAFPVEENTITPYLVARYYRAPEIILGCPYDPAVDMWSAACTIFELYTGKMLFPGRDNNEMLKLIMQTKGQFNNKMVKRGEFSSQYFDRQNNFLSTEIDPVTKLKYVKPIPIGGKITRDIGNLLNAVEIELSDEDKKKLVQLKDLLERCLTLDPNKRISPDEALRHTFINYTVQKITTDHSALKHAF